MNFSKCMSCDKVAVWIYDTLRDDRKTAETLFTLLNMIVDKTVSEPKHIAALYASLPESAIQAIERRDGKV